jgi:hypothetical protein
VHINDTRQGRCVILVNSCTQEAFPDRHVSNVVTDVGDDTR